MLTIKVKKQIRVPTLKQKRVWPFIQRILAEVDETSFSSPFLININLGAPVKI